MHRERQHQTRLMGQNGSYVNDFRLDTSAGNACNELGLGIYTGGVQLGTELLLARVSA